jgi:hypothetical protein
VSLPPGYEAAIPAFLAEELAPEYQMPVPQAVQVLAKRHRRNLANANVSMPILKTPFQASHFNILTNGSV